MTYEPTGTSSAGVHAICVRTGPERRLRRPADAARPDPGPDGVEPHARPPAEPEEDARRVAPRALGRDRDEHRPVAREGLRRAADRDLGRMGDARVLRERGARERRERRRGAGRRPEQAPPCEPDAAHRGPNASEPGRARRFRPRSPPPRAPRPDAPYASRCRSRCRDRVSWRRRALARRSPSRRSRPGPSYAAARSRSLVVPLRPRAAARRSSRHPNRCRSPAVGLDVRRT